MENKPFLFEVSWEVCNKVGGIYTVLRSKLKQVAANFGSNYLLIGPIIGNNRHFVEDNTSPLSSSIAAALQEKNIHYQFGYWDTEGKPLVLLLDFHNRYNVDALLYALWTDFNIDSSASNYEYYEPILFSTLAGEVIELLVTKVLANPQVVGHFHEWLCGAGILYLKKYCPDVATVFTTHATVLGRALSGENRLIYNLPKNFDPAAEAKRCGVFAKHSLECAAAREADCFTTVSNITADEANVMLGKYPDKIVLNGLDVEKKHQAVSLEKTPATRQKLLQIASSIKGSSLPANTIFWLTSGRYEFHNKGFDVLLRSLEKLESNLLADAPPIVMLFLVASRWCNKGDSLLENQGNLNPEQRGALGIATHRIDHPGNDPIIRLARELGFNQPQRKISIVYSDAYLNGEDGVFDIHYEDVLAACDLSIFASFYEPWGYTPHESIAYSTPTLTTDLTGFGYWVASLKRNDNNAAHVLSRRNESDTNFVSLLCEQLKVLAKTQTPAENKNMRKQALDVAALADWRFFYEEYLDAYAQALKFNEIYRAKFNVAGLEEKDLTSIHEAEAVTPRMRVVQYECPLPKELVGLRELAYNFWWSWHDDAKELFKKIDAELWEQVKHNPVHFLNLVSNVTLSKAAHDRDCMWFYNKVLTNFNSAKNTNATVAKFHNAALLTAQKPLAYFCMEYGIDECLPSYSGGLGILAGDYLKVMSDLRVPMVAVGLFYKQGYFFQSINARGEQVAAYETWNINNIPIKQLRDESGKPLLVGVEAGDRTIYASIWEVKVGYVNLYLLDTDVTLNSAADRTITNSLYGGSKENRLLQEILLGVGGTRLLTEKLNLAPLLYHLNEGHSAFLLLERIQIYTRQGFTFDEATEIVRCSSIFTTHTPVAAGNETFPEELIRRYFATYVEKLGITIDRLFDLAKDADVALRAFSMTALSLRLTLNANAVSRLHGYVARAMWKNIWPGLLEDEVPIDYVTNGVHLRTWLGSPMKLLCQDYINIDWDNIKNNVPIWEKVSSIPDQQLWKAHQTQKENLITLVKRSLIQQYSVRNEDKQLLADSLNCLNVNTLLVGLARRFTAYKRNDLILMDKEHLARILTNEERPIVMIIAGKAHPADSGGADLIREVIETLRDKKFKGHIIFIEEYNIALAKALVQGVDLWINTPILGREACGTSGMKVGVNGGLNFSTRDGWWDEAYTPNVGWEVESLTNISDLKRRNSLENMFMLNKLELEVAPLYYDNQKKGFSREWVEKMKASIMLIAAQYGTRRMAFDYINRLYNPALLQTEQLSQNNYGDLKAVVTWKKEIIERFNTVKIKAILINGIKDGKIIEQGLIRAKLLLFSGKLKAQELKAELVLIKSDGTKSAGKAILVPLKLMDTRETGMLTYTGEYQLTDTGFYSYGIRVFPYNGLLFRQQDAGVMYWG